MLVMSGKTNDRFFIGDNIEVVIVDVRSGVARLGFAAPKSVPINREKVHVAKQREPKDSHPEARSPGA